MTDKERINWLFIEFMKMETRAERAEKELAESKLPPIHAIFVAASLRRWRGGPKRKD